MMKIDTMKKIDATGAPVLDELITKALDEGNNDLVIDLAETEYISSVGLRVFASAQKRVNKELGQMVLVNVSPRMLEVFEVTGFSGILTIE